MVATLPATGRATWTDRVDNWRVLDTDWVQDRLVLRYAAGLTTMGEGTVYYDTAQQCLMVRNSTTSNLVADHACVAAAANLKVVPGTTDTTVTLGHKTSPGNGLVITSTGALVVKPSIATVGNTVLIDATGITLHTGTQTAKLTTDGSTLHSDTAISAPSFTGVVTASSTSAGALTATSGTFSSNVGVTGTFGVTGATSLGLVNIASTLNFGSRLGQHINLYGTAYGIGIQSSNLYFRSGSAYKFYVGGVHSDTPSAATLSIDTNSIDVTGGLTVTGTVAVNTTLYVGAVGVFGGNGGQVRMVDTSAGGNDVYMSFYGNGTTTVTGTRNGYIGYPGSTTLTVVNEMLNGGIRLACSGSGTLTLATGTSGDISMVTGAAGNIIMNAGSGGSIVFTYGGAERGRAQGSFMWGKSTGGLANVGVELFESGTIYATTANNSTPCMSMRHNTDAAAAFIQFWNSGGGVLSEFQQSISPSGTRITNCTAVPPSDYRWKNDLGPITGALDRVAQLQPKRLSWKATSKEFDGFIAHEATGVVPYLVFGKKDAIQDNGDIDGQGFDYGGLTALLTAAIQELKGRVDALESLS